MQPVLLLPAVSSISSLDSNESLFGGPAPAPAPQLQQQQEAFPQKSSAPDSASSQASEGLPDGLTSPATRAENFNVEAIAPLYLPLPPIALMASAAQADGASRPQLLHGQQGSISLGDRPQPAAAQRCGSDGEPKGGRRSLDSGP